eukprot:766673-Hanusia_phi.AAC.5
MPSRHRRPSDRLLGATSSAMPPKLFRVNWSPPLQMSLRCARQRTRTAQIVNIWTTLPRHFRTLHRQSRGIRKLINAELRVSPSL